MPKAYSSDLRERLIAAVGSGMSRCEAAELFDVAISTSQLEQHTEPILAVIDERPDATLKEILAALGKHRIRTSRSALSRFLGRHNITRKSGAGQYGQHNEH